MKSYLLIATLFAAAIPVSVPTQASSAPANASVYIISPADGAVVSNPVKVVFGLANMGVAPAGIERENTGHHHLIIDSPLPEPGKPIPADDKHKHFGGGQTETELTLTPGKHSLQLLLGDQLHMPHQPVVASKPVNITVK